MKHTNEVEVWTDLLAAKYDISSSLARDALQQNNFDFVRAERWLNELESTTRSCQGCGQMHVVGADGDPYCMQCARLLPPRQLVFDREQARAALEAAEREFGPDTGEHISAYYCPACNSTGRLLTLFEPCRFCSA